MSSNYLMVPVVVVEGDGVEGRVDLLQCGPVAQVRHQVLPGLGPGVAVGARQDADPGGLGAVSDAKVLQIVAISQVCVTVQRS